MHQKYHPKYQKCLLFRKNPKCIRNASQIPIFSLPAPLPWTNSKTFFVFYTSIPNYCTLSLIPTFQHCKTTPKWQMAANN